MKAKKQYWIISIIMLILLFQIKAYSEIPTEKFNDFGITNIWRFNETIGSWAYDEKGKAVLSINTLPPDYEHSTGVEGMNNSFDMTFKGQQKQMVTNLTNIGSANRSECFWLNFTNTSSAYLLRHETGVGMGDIYVLQLSNNSLQFQFYNDSTNDKSFISQRIDNNTWGFYCWTFNNNTGNISIYMNSTFLGYLNFTIGSHSYTTNGTKVGDNAGIVKVKIDEYSIYNKTLNPSEIEQIYSGAWYQNSSFNIRFLNEETNLLLNTSLIYGELTSVANSSNFSTSNGTLYYRFDPKSWQNKEFRISYQANGFSKRYYYQLVQFDTNYTIDLYLLNSTNSKVIELSVQNRDNLPLTNYLVVALAYFVDCNCWKTVEMSKSGFNGIAIMSLIQYEKNYYFKVYNENYIEKFVSNETKITSTAPYFSIDTMINPLESIQGMEGVYTLLTFENSSSKFTYSFADTKTNFLTGGCLEVMQKTSITENLVCSNCTTGISGTLTCTIDQTIQANYIAKGKLLTNTKYTNPITDILNIFTGDNYKVMGSIGIISAFLIVLISIFLFNSAIITLIVTISMVIFLGILGFIPVATFLIWVVIFGAIFIVIKGRGQ